MSDDGRSTTTEGKQPLAFLGQGAFYGYVATVMTLAALIILIVGVMSWFAKEPVLPRMNSLPGDEYRWGFLLLLAGSMAAFFWRLSLLRMRPLLRVGLEGIEVNLGVAYVPDFPTRWLTIFGWMRTSVGWIPWYEVKCVEARPSVTNFATRMGVNGGLVIEGAILPKSGEGPSPSGVPIGTSLAIITAEFRSTPGRVAEKIYPYLNDPQLRQTLPSLWET
ncbi:hypothetical protein LOC68_17540 [Blastopirellula sp. JC732]|uniref:Uncharacterized protein n=1 Tax=Blastopirellula sediminis TaxID=2894196 RepID=A0A9X1MNU3_9BACT|nr:hypothetical protein [Blastopirellula sediminis]MCC9606501.1 hypothetical protein [Blastopirellula sediminis]MCC9630201.1 hypothetical protein [Blastopirellula sediminis]